jgi:PKD repeat protein
VTVNVSSAPTLVITPPTTAPSSGLPATFTFVTTVPAANGSAIRNVTVRWGDGQTQDLGALTGTAVVAHVYRTPGTYAITATVTDSFGNSSVVSTAVIVNPAILALTITPPATLPSAGLPASFTIGVGTLPPGDAVRNVHLEWGDGSSLDLGSISANTTVSHVYRTAATYTVTGILTDTAGNTVSNATSVTVIPVPRPTIIITPPTNGRAGTQVLIGIQVTLAPGISVQNLSINFGDGTGTQNLGGASSAQVPHTYAAAGTYIVTVTVVDTSGQTTEGTAIVSIAS